MKTIPMWVVRSIQILLGILIVFNLGAYLILHRFSFLYLILAYIFVLGMTLYRAGRGVQDSFYAGILGVAVGLLDLYQPAMQPYRWATITNIVLPALLLVLSRWPYFRR
jgi:hypothetical protein